MQYRELGRSGISVSLICLGNMTWGEQNSEAEGHAQLDYALDHGVNFVDTAEMYAVPTRRESQGRSEEILGSWMTRHKRRQDVIVATKVSGRSTRFPYLRPHLHDGVTRLDRSSILEAVEGSLKRLRTDYIDLYQVHWPERSTNNFGQLDYQHTDADDDVPIAETLATLGELVTAGKLLRIGISNETPWGVQHYLRLAERHGLPVIDSIQNPYNLLMRDYDIAMAEISIREQVGLLAYSPLAGGVLSGKYLDGQRPAGARLTLYGDMFPRYMSPRAQRETAIYVDIARRHGLDPAQMANAFVNSRPFVTSNIIGARTLPQLEVAVATAEMTLDDDVLAAIEAAHSETPVGY